jgi:hypothetical protein
MLYIQLNTNLIASSRMADQTTVWGKFKAFMGGTVIATIGEINSLIPDSILFGSLLLYALTQNIAFGVFGVFIFETVLSHRLISWVSAQSVGPSRSVDLSCRAGFKVPQFAAQRMFSHDAYPSYSIFSISAIATYLLLATKEFSNTLQAMGPEWQSRSKVAYAFIALVLAAFVIIRLIKCDSLGEVLIAFCLALIVGATFFYVNKSIFGEEAMNFLGLPYMVSKESQGAPIYICSADTNQPQ